MTPLLPGGEPYPDVGTVWPAPRIGDDSIVGQAEVRRALIRRVRGLPQLTVRTNTSLEADDLAYTPSLWPGSGVSLSVSAHGRVVSFAVDIEAIRHGDSGAVGRASAALQDMEGYARKLGDCGRGGWRVSRRPRWRFRGVLRRGVSV